MDVQGILSAAMSSLQAYAPVATFAIFRGFCLYMVIVLAIALLHRLSLHYAVQSKVRLQQQRQLDHLRAGSQPSPVE